MRALVLHGFTGSTDTVKLLKDCLELNGVTSSMPVLRGHGTEHEHLFRVHWRDWLADARDALLELSPNGEETVVAGLSMGAMLACILATEFPQRVQKIALLAPAFDFQSPLVHATPLLKKFFKTWSTNPEFADPNLAEKNTNYLSFPVESFEQVLALSRVSQDLLPKVTCPVGIFCGSKDPVIQISTLKKIEKALKSTRTTRKMYKRSYHELLLDVERDQVAEDVISFLMA